MTPPLSRLAKLVGWIQQGVYPSKERDPEIVFLALAPELLAALKAGWRLSLKCNVVTAYARHQQTMTPALEAMYEAQLNFEEAERALDAAVNRELGQGDGR